MFTIKTDLQCDAYYIGKQIEEMLVVRRYCLQMVAMNQQFPTVHVIVTS
jgi:hypothetical protein